MHAMTLLPVRAARPELSVIARGLRRCDPELLDSLIEQYQHRLLRYLSHLLSDRELARDLCQETWIRVLERGHQYNSRYKFSTWLYTIARNIALDHLRKRRSISLEGLTSEHEDSVFEPRDVQPLAWELLEQREQAERIHTALLGIPAQYREAVVLRFQEELALNEIATVVGAPLGTVKSRLARGLNLLMEQLKEVRL